MADPSGESKSEALRLDFDPHSPDEVSILSTLSPILI